MDNKKLTKIVCTLGIIFIFVVILAYATTNNNKSPKKVETSIIGKYELQELIRENNTYTKDTLKTELGRKITLEVTKKEIIKTTTYYSPDGLSSDSVEKYTYDKEKIYDLEATSQAFYTYSLVDDKLILKNLEIEETMLFKKEG